MKKTGRVANKIKQRPIRRYEEAKNSITIDGLTHNSNNTYWKIRCELKSMRNEERLKARKILSLRCYLPGLSKIYLTIAKTS